MSVPQAVHLISGGLSLQSTAMATESRKLVILALIANAIIAVIKFIAAGISGSSAMLAEAFHSVADSGNQLFLLRGTAVLRATPPTSIILLVGARSSTSGASWLRCSCLSVVPWWPSTRASRSIGIPR